MFGWLRPRCPIDAREKTWIELRMAWLAGQFGLAPLRAAEVILPTAEYFPETYSPTEAGARRLFVRLCDYARVDPAGIELEFFDDPDPADAARRASGTVVRSQGAAGFYECGGGRRAVHVAEWRLPDPEALAATLIHELAHDLLVGSGRLTGQEEDQEALADLLPVYLGLGVFGANAVLRESHSAAGVWQRWTMAASGYLQARHFGYAMALFAWFRAERRPAWAAHLRLDARATLASALRYLERTGDSVFHPETEGRPYASQSTVAILDDLRDGTDGCRLAALWELRDRKLNGHHAAAVEAAIEALRHPNPIVRCEAAGTLDQFGQAAREAVPALKRALTDSHGRVRIAAAFALGNIGADEEIIADLIGLLSDRQPAVANAAAWALARYGHSAAAAAPQLVRLLRLGLVECEFALIDQTLETLSAVTDDPERAIVAQLGGRDSELCQRAVAALRERAEARVATPPDVS